jgi:MYXO-CTERM domain-containing protein
LTAPPGSGGSTLHLNVLFDGQPLLSRDLPIAVDHWLANDGVSARGGCAFGPRPNAALGAWAALGALGLLFERRRRRHMLAK